MTEEQPPGFVDRVVDAVAGAMNAVGLNGTRLRWKWNARKREAGEGAMRREMHWRSARAKHKMCPSCRTLVARSARVCDECGRDLGDVRAPGVTRAASNLLPGMDSPTSLILLVNGFLFLLLLLKQAQSDLPSGGGLLGGFNGRILVGFGSGWSALSVGYGEWWRFVTPIFLHGGLLHFFFNSYMLINLGQFAEREFGKTRFWVIYLTTGIAGAFVSQALRSVNTVGASGAIMGLVGLLLAHGWRRGDSFGELMKSSMLRFLAYMLVFSLIVPGIDHINHLGGLLTGGVFGWFVGSKTLTGTSRQVWALLAVAGVLLVMVSFAMVALNQHT